MKLLEVQVKEVKLPIWVTEDGQIYFFHKKKKYKSLINTNGYEIVRLNTSLKGVRMSRNISVHRLVAAAYLGDVEGRVVNHLNCIKSDNRVENLEITTRLENARHAIRNRRNPHHGEYRLFVAALAMHHVAKMPIREIAARLNWSRPGIHFWISGKHEYFTKLYEKQGNVLDFEYWDVTTERARTIV